MSEARGSKSASPLEPSVELAASLWWMVLIEGVAVMLLGLFLLFRPSITAVVLVQFIGVWWLIQGVVSLVGLLTDRAHWWLKLFMGVLGIVAGAMVIAQPLLSPIIMGAIYIVLLGINGLIMGITELVRAFTGGGWPVGLLGAFSVVVSVLLLASPVATAFAIPFVFGIIALFFGTGSVVGAFKLRKLAAI